jgi:hypothetical protein
MTRLFTAGAEETTLTALWDTIYDTAGYFDFIWRYDNAQAAGWTPVGGPRTGPSCYFARDVAYLEKTFGSNPTELYTGCAIQVSAARTDRQCIDFWCGTKATGLRFSTSGVIVAVRDGTTLANSATSSYATGVWHYIEIWLKPLNSGGRFVVKVDGSIVIDYTGDTTNDKEYVTSVRFSGNYSNINQAVFYDDIVINDAAGSFNNTYPGQIKLLPIPIRGAGDAANLTREGMDYGYNYANAAMYGNLQATVVGATPGLKDLYALATPDLPPGAAISNVILQAKGLVGAGAGGGHLVLKSGSVEKLGTTGTALSAAWKMLQDCFPQDPAITGSWTEAALSALQIGIVTE